MNEITGVLVDGHMFDIKNDMTDDSHFPNSLFPGATFKMVIDNDPANNTKVRWIYSTNITGSPLAVSADGTVTFPGIDEKCCGESFHIIAVDKETHKITTYTFTVKRFFKYSAEAYTSVKDISPWIENMHGVFPDPLDVDSQVYDGETWHGIKRDVNGGLYQEWGTMSNSGWAVNPTVIVKYDSCNIFTFDKEKNTYYILEDSGYHFNDGEYFYAQAVALYGTSRG